LVLETGMGSLTGTRPTRMLVGAKVKLGAFSKEARPQEFGVGQTTVVAPKGRSAQQS